MPNTVHLETDRLRLRPWSECDRDSFAALTADPVVMKDQGGPLSRGDSDRKFDRYVEAFETFGYGRWLVETTSGEFLGYCGIMTVGSAHPLGAHNEIGWRLIHKAWGKGFATEAARAALLDAFERIGLPDVLAYTAADNFRSQAVMERLQLQRDESRDFSTQSDSQPRRCWVWVARPEFSAAPTLPQSPESA